MGEIPPIQTRLEHTAFEQSAQLVLIELSLLNMKMLKKTHHYTQEQTDIINTPTSFPSTLQAYEEDVMQSLNFIHTGKKMILVS